MTEDEDEVEVDDGKYPVCPHCGLQTGDRLGHRRRWCQIGRYYRSLHYCCPTGCEIEEKAIKGGDWS
jgi:hypothetical protein